MTTYFRRNLPHYHLPNATYFVTFRLAGSLPFEAVHRLQETYETELRRIDQTLSGSQRMNARQKAQEAHFARVDSLLDQVLYGPRWLSRAKCAQTVADCIHELEPKHYHLHAFCIMPNHVHLLIDQQEIPDPMPRRDGRRYTTLSRTLRLLKGKSTALCNRILGRRGAFWQHESYDHVIRNEPEYRRVLRYILENPLKAGLVDEWEQWPYLYVADV